MVDRLALALLPFLLLLGSCAGLSNFERQYETATARSCAAKGAFLDRRGMFGTAMCVTPYADAGKVCRFKSECVGRCMVELGTPETNARDYSIGVETVGKCEPDDRTFGCYAVVDAGKVTEAVCDD